MPLPSFQPSTSPFLFQDIYIIAGLIFICLQVMVVCIISVYAKKQHKNAAKLNTYFGFAMAILLAFFNVVYLAYLFILVGSSF